MMKKRQRASVLSGTYSLEERVALSSIGPSNPIPLASQIDTLPRLGQKAASLSHARPHSASGIANHTSFHPGNAIAAPTAKRWSWLANTYWYVPPANLPAVLFNSSSGTLAPVSDQTVFKITGYRAGYFWGKTVTQLGSGSASCSSLVGSVTPEGRVLLTFTKTSDTSSPSVTEGFGMMVRRNGRWSMENQMFTSPSQSLQIGHWAYMTQTRPGLPSWNSLPSSGLSVPAFLSQCDGQGPQPIGS